MNGKCEGCKYRCLRPYKLDNVYDSPACSNLKEEYDKCIKIKGEYTELPIHIHD